MDIHVLWVADHKSFSVKPHTHEFYQLAFVRKKGGLITIGENTYQAKPDFVYLMKPSVLHSIKRQEDLRLIEVKFLVKDDKLAKKLNALPDEFIFEDVAFMKNILFQTVEEGLSGAAYCNETTNSAFKIFLAHALREFDKNSPSEKLDNLDYNVLYGNFDSDKNNNDILILSLKDYVENRIKEDITLKDLADTVYFNPTYFVRRFKILWGVTPMKFVNDVRLNKAKQLMATTSLTVTEIAEECGFKSLHYFSRAFKQKESVSPTEYLKKFKIKE